MTLNEFDTAAKESLLEECRRLQALAAEGSRQPLPVMLTAEAEQFIGKLPGFALWSSVPEASKSNAKMNFAGLNQLGDRIGFLDSGKLIKNGNHGIMFCKKGLLTRGIGDDFPSSVTFKDLCVSVLILSGVSFSDYKYRAKRGAIPVIKASPKMFRILSGIRDALLTGSPAAQAAFRLKCQQLITDIESAVDADQRSALSDAIDTFDTYLRSAPQMAGIFSHRLRVLRFIREHRFDTARALAETYGGDEASRCGDLIRKWESDYRAAVCRSHYDRAMKSAEHGDDRTALSEIKTALEQWDGEKEVWLLYAAIVCRTANEDNGFLWDDVLRLKEPCIGHDTHRREAYLFYRNQIEEIADRFRRFLAASVERVKENDVTFFERRPFLVNVPDRYGMTPLMYAALLHKKSVFEALLNKTSDRGAKNLLGLDCGDLCVLSCGDPGEYDDIVGSWDPWYREKKRAYRLSKARNETIKGVGSFLADIFEYSSASDSTDAWKEKSRAYSEPDERAASELLERSAEKADRAEQMKDAAQSCRERADLAKDDLEAAGETYPAEIAEHFSAHKERVMRILSDAEADPVSAGCPGDEFPALIGYLRQFVVP